MGSNWGGTYAQFTPITDTYTALTSDDAIIATITAAKTVTLYSPAGVWVRNSAPGGRIFIVNSASSTNVLTVAPASATNIVGPTSLSPGQCATYFSDGGVNWYADAGSGNSTNQLTTSVTIATAAVLTLHTTPVSLIAAPGAGKAIVVDSVSVKLTFNSIAYTGANAASVQYTDGSGLKLTADITSAFLDSAATAYYSVFGAAVLPTLNAPVVLAVASADPGAGNSPLALTIRYRILS